MDDGIDDIFVSVDKQPQSMARALVASRFRYPGLRLPKDDTLVFVNTIVQ